MGLFLPEPVRRRAHAGIGISASLRSTSKPSGRHARRGFSRTDYLSRRFTPLTLLFARRFRFSPHTKLYLSESHSQAVRPEIINGVNRVMSFDAHHDCGYGSGIKSASRGETYCDNWTIPYYMRGAAIEVYYPVWRKRNEPGDSEIPFELIRSGRRNFHDPDSLINRVFICRSGAWVPPWHDQAFNEFVASFSLPVIDVGTYPREWSLANVEEHTQRLEQVKNRLYAQV